MKSIERYSDIKPIRRKLIEHNEKLIGVVVFHDASVSTVSSIIYLVVENDDGWKELRIAKAGTKNHNGSVPVLEHVSRTYSLVMIKPLLADIRQVGGPGVIFQYIQIFSVAIPVPEPAKSGQSHNCKLQPSRINP